MKRITIRKLDYDYMPTAYTEDAIEIKYSPCNTFIFFSSVPASVDNRYIIYLFYFNSNKYQFH